MSAGLAVQEQIPDLRGGEDLVAQIQGHDGRLASNLVVVEDDGGRLGVHEDVELGPRRVVADALHAVDGAHGRIREAAAKRAAHETEALYVGHELRVLAEEGAHVGEGARGHDPGGAGGLRLERLGHGVDAGDGRRRALGLGKEIGPVEARVAMDVGRRVDGRTLQRLA